MAKIRSGDIAVTGLAELNRALRELESGLQPALREASLDAAQMVATAAKARGLSLGGVAARVAPTLSARASTTSAGVAFGGSGHPEAMGAEFGGRGRPTTQQFQPHRGHEGYFVYPTIRDQLDDITARYAEALGALLDKAGLA